MVEGEGQCSGSERTLVVTAVVWYGMWSRPRDGDTKATARTDETKRQTWPSARACGFGGRSKGKLPTKPRNISLTFSMRIHREHPFDNNSIVLWNVKLLVGAASFTS